MYDIQTIKAQNKKLENDPKQFTQPEGFNHEAKTLIESCKIDPVTLQEHTENMERIFQECKREHKPVSYIIEGMENSYSRRELCYCYFQLRKEAISLQKELFKTLIRQEPQPTCDKVTLPIDPNIM